MNTSTMFKKIARGSILFSFGVIGANFIQFVSGILVIRLVQTTEFGLISLAYMLVNLLATIATLGFYSGLPRFMSAQTNGQKSFKVGAAIGSVMAISLAAGVVATLLMFNGGAYFARVFAKPGLAHVLEIFTFLIIPLVTLNVLTATFRGLENPKPKVWFVDLLANLLRLGLLCLIFYIGADFDYVLWAYLTAVWVAALVFCFYAARTLKSSIRLTIDPKIAREITLFSLPLLGVILATNMMGWSGTFMLGIFNSPEEVAFFNVPMRLVNFIPLPLIAMGYLYLPVVTGLIKNNRQNQLHEMYIVTTKWAFLLTLPVLLFCLLDTRFLIISFFGERYLEVVNVLRILVVGYSISTFVGPNGITLMAAGDSKTVFLGVLLASAGSIILCFLLVPHYGAIGAALATTSSLLISNCFLSIVLHRKMAIHPFSLRYFKSVITVVFLSVATALFMGIESQVNWIWHILFFSLLIVFAVASPFITMTMTELDLELFAGAERKFFRSTRFSNYITKKLG